MQLSNKQGFTLIELMIVIVILAVLVALAVPFYGKSAMKARREAAADMLLKAATIQEQRFFTTQSYTNNKALLGGPNSKKDYYTLDVFFPGGDATAGYTMTATVNSKGGQADDDECRVFTITHTQKVSVSDGANDTTQRCWPY